jgi:23S rRNA (pseudouridine1915-N3)-methyltransferase
MKISLLQTGKTDDRCIADLSDLYRKRITRYSPFEIITIPDLKNCRKMPVEERMMKEGTKILQYITGSDYIVLLDEKGEEFRTIQFSEWFEKLTFLTKKRIVFIIGGPYGFSSELYDKADFRLSLSKMTIPHQLVRLLFLEQLYRVFTIINGEPYHHE